MVDLAEDGKYRGNEVVGRTWWDRQNRSCVNSVGRTFGLGYDQTSEGLQCLGERGGIYVPRRLIIRLYETPY